MKSKPSKPVLGSDKQFKEFIKKNKIKTNRAEAKPALSLDEQLMAIFNKIAKEYNSSLPLDKKKKHYTSVDNYYWLKDAPGCIEAEFAITNLINTFATGYAAIKSRYPNLGLGNTQTDDAVITILYSAIHWGEVIK